MPDSVLRDTAPPEHWRPMLAAGTLWVAGDAGKLVAFLAATPLEGRLHIDEFGVALEAQRQGLGRRMLGEVVAWARRAGCACVSLTTFADIAWNAPFYRSMGFEAWTDDQPLDIRLALAGEAQRGLERRCAMRLLL